MSKELDYLDKILNYQPLTLVERTIIECIKEKVQRAEAIDNANPSEALECLERIDKGFRYVTEDDDGYKFNEPQKMLDWYDEEFDTIKQALQSINLLMQELECNDMETLRKYARCGKEIEVPENE